MRFYWLTTGVLAFVVAALSLRAPHGQAADPPVVVRQTAPMETLVVRFRPGDDLYERLQQIVEAEQIDAGCVLACAGSLQQVALRYADRPEATQVAGKQEIVSLSGTLSRLGSHLHMSVSDGQGQTRGGHLMAGCQVYTTVELVIGVLPGLRFERELDPQSGYRELVVRPKP